MARSSYKTFLMYKKTSSATFEKLIDIRNYPNLGGEPEMLDTTTLSDGITTQIPGIQSGDAMTFTALYDLSEYKRLKELEGTEYEFAVWFGATGSGSTLVPTGEDGKWKFKGQMVVFPTGAESNTVAEMEISIARSGEIEFDND
jgi:hypothetical protein